MSGFKGSKYLGYVLAIPVTGLVAYAAWGGIQQTRPVESTVILPQMNESVEQVSNVSCQVRVGWPIVMVRDDDKSSPWWIQRPCELASARTFITKANFGNETTPVGTKFCVAILTAPTQDVAAKFEPGQTIQDLPTDLPVSQIVEVTRK
jgi:hypothetical protein